MPTLVEIHRAVSALAGDISELANDFDRVSTRVGRLEDTYERVRKAVWALTLAIVGPFAATAFGVGGVLFLRHFGVQG